MAFTYEEIVNALGTPASVTLGKSEDPSKPIELFYRCSCRFDMSYGGSYAWTKTCGSDHFPENMA
jgi:hypothetical protein